MPNSTKKVLTKGSNDPEGLDYVGPDGVTYSLNRKQKLFCLAYLDSKANRVESIVSAGYDVYYKNKKGISTGVLNYKLAAAMAKEMLLKPKIFNYINLKLDESGFNDENIDKQALFLANQHGDLSAKSKGIDIINKIKGRYVTKVEHSLDEETIKSLQKISEALPD